MMYAIILAVLFVIMVIYFRVAVYYNIIDRPNHRSSHETPTIRGGGVIFWFAGLLYFAQHVETAWLFTSLSIVSMVSFWDDISSLPNKIRITAHFLAISIIFYELGIFNALPVWAVGIAYIVCIGIINAYNFMDGINGITGCYTLVILGSLLYVNKYIHHFTEDELVIYPILACLVFLFFNFRKKAKCFAGDVGSIAIAVWIIYLLLKLILGTGNFSWILFLAVYGVDSICTIIHRLYLKQNIFKAHRLHFYQVLSNEYKIPHRLVSTLYAGTQMGICALVMNNIEMAFSKLLIISLLPLLLVYSTKFYLLKKKASPDAPGVISH